MLNEQWIAKWRALAREAMKAPGGCLFERDEITDRLGEITCPALVIHGTADISIEPALAEELCRGRRRPRADRRDARGLARGG